MRRSFLLSCRMWPASWKKVNQKRSSVLPRRLRRIMALSGVSHSVAPLQGAFFISGTKARATPAEAQKRTISGTKASGDLRVKARIWRRQTRKRGLENGSQGILWAASWPRRSQAEVGPGLEAKQGERRAAAAGCSHTVCHACTLLTP